jgi:GR25 family glycosyltransferase involved in LPS biosynthesis
MDQIDSFYFINLDKRTDRLEEISGELRKMEIPPEKVMRVAAYEHNFGILGNVISHIFIIKHFIQSGKDRCLIMEDDFQFTETKEKTNEILTKIFNSKYEIDCLMLAGNSNSVLMNLECDGALQKVFWASCTVGYCITKEYAPLLLHNFQEGAAKLEKWITAFNETETSFTLDFYWIHEQVRSQYYFTVPKLGRQSGSASDITSSYKQTMTVLFKNK